MATLKMMLLIVATALVAGSCSPTYLVVRREMQVGDRQRDWALVYYHSWRVQRKPGYLELSRRYMYRAITTYFTLQKKIGHSYPDFYIIDDRRRAGCLFLNEMNRKAAMFGRSESEVHPGEMTEGCFGGHERPPVY